MIIIRGICENSAKRVLYSYERKQTVYIDTSPLVCRSICERRGREADAAVRDVEDVVEPLEEGHAVDEVEALAAEAPDVVHNEEDRVGVATDRRIHLKVWVSVAIVVRREDTTMTHRAGPHLGVRRELEDIL